MSCTFCRQTDDTSPVAETNWVPEAAPLRQRRLYRESTVYLGSPFRGNVLGRVLNGQPNPVVQACIEFVAIGLGVVSQAPGMPARS